MLHRPLPRLLPLLLPLLGLLALSLLVDGCQTPSTSGAAPPTALQTFDALYANAVTADDLAVKAATVSLQAGLITAAQARTVLHVTDSVKVALDAARTASQLGNTALASGNLASALGPVAILSACLTSKPLTPATFETCTTRLAPVHT